MNKDEIKGYYLAMLNGLRGLQDDLLVNGAPKEASEHLDEVLRICLADYENRIEKMFEENRD